MRISPPPIVYVDPWVPVWAPNIVDVDLDVEIPVPARSGSRYRADRILGALDQTPDLAVGVAVGDEGEQ